LADDADPLRALLRAARQWRVAPTVFLGQRKAVTVYDYDGAGRVVRATANDWTTADTDLAWALDQYEAGLCPGCQRALDETSKAEHVDAYRPEPPIRCHYCTSKALTNEVAEKQENPAGLLYSFKLDPDVVELNRQPVPPLPPELQQRT
jgi:DNA-directed RNA polymerase subunit RPC12/RpoP